MLKEFAKDIAFAVVVFAAWEVLRPFLKRWHSVALTALSGTLIVWVYFPLAWRIELLLFAGLAMLGIAIDWDIHLRRGLSADAPERAFAPSSAIRAASRFVVHHLHLQASTAPVASVSMVVHRANRDES